MSIEEKEILAKQFLDNHNIADRAIIAKRIKGIAGETQLRTTLIKLLAKYHQHIKE